jgi:hypothetical protein
MTLVNHAATARVRLTAITQAPRQGEVRLGLSGRVGSVPGGARVLFTWVIRSGHRTVATHTASATVARAGRLRSSWTFHTHGLRGLSLYTAMTAVPQGAGVAATASRTEPLR